MKLRTSFFNPAVLKKDITRFAPVWGLYTIGMLLVLLLIPYKTDSFEFPLFVSEMFCVMSIVNLLYAGLCAAVLFGDLYNSRLCNALHALPLRREGWFFTHSVAGLMFCIVPNTLIACLGALFLQEFAYLAFLWLAVMVLQFLFFFGVGAISALCAGNRLGMAALYAILNLLSYIVALFISSLFLPLLYGLEVDLEVFTKFCPLVEMVDGQYILSEADYMRRSFLFQGLDPETWHYTAIAAGVGLALLGLSVVAYRKRQLETAGDLISVRWLRPVFLVIYTLGVGVVLLEIADLMGAGLSYVFLLVGMAIGFFTGKMLLERKVHVFKGKAFLGFALLLAVLGLSMGLVRMDPLGIVQQVPEVEKVEKVTVSRSSFYDEDQYSSGLTLTQDADISTITQIHSLLAQDRYQEDDGVVIYLRYYLEDGTCVKRCYRVRPESPAQEALAPFFGRWEYIFGTSDWQSMLDSADYGSVYQFAGDQELVLAGPETLGYEKEENAILLTEENRHLLTDLLTAIRQDCEDGNMAQDWPYYEEEEAVGWIYLSDNDGRYSCDISFYKTSTNTLRAIDALKQAVSQ